MRTDDPVKQCPVYKDEGCTHVDGYLCDYPKCSIVEQYLDERKEDYNESRAKG